MSKRKLCTIAAWVTPMLLWCVIAAVPAHSHDEAAWSIDAQGNLIIHAQRITHEPVFIPLQVEGQRMEILALRAGDGKVRVAFNTCQVCSGSPRAYFVPHEGGVACRNCGNVFPAEQVGGASQGCNPLAVPTVEATASGDIAIPASVQAAYVGAFRNWKRGL